MEFAPFGQDGIPLTREKKQNAECYIIHWNLHKKGVSKPLIKSFCRGPGAGGWQPRPIKVCSFKFKVLP